MRNFYTPLFLTHTSLSLKHEPRSPTVAVEIFRAVLIALKPDAQLAQLMIEASGLPP